MLLYVSSEEQMENSMQESRLVARKLSLIAMESQYLIRMVMLKHMMSMELSAMRRHLIQVNSSVMRTWEWGFTVIIPLRTERHATYLMLRMSLDRVLPMHYRKLRITDSI